MSKDDPFRQLKTIEFNNDYTELFGLNHGVVSFKMETVVMSF